MPRKQTYQTATDEFGSIWVLPIEIGVFDPAKLKADQHGVFEYDGNRVAGIYGPYPNEQTARSFYERLPHDGDNN